MPTRTRPMRPPASRPEQAALTSPKLALGGLSFLMLTLQVFSISPIGLADAILDCESTRTADAAAVVPITVAATPTIPIASGSVMLRRAAIAIPEETATASITG
jgi:hypothetical protein